MDELQRHYEQAMRVAQAAWDYCNPPERNADNEAKMKAKLKEEVHKLRQLELELSAEGAEFETIN